MGGSYRDKYLSYSIIQLICAIAVNNFFITFGKLAGLPGSVMVNFVTIVWRGKKYAERIPIIL